MILKLKNINFNNIKSLFSNKVSFGKKGLKYFVGYKHGKNVRSLYILLPKWVYIDFYKNFYKTQYFSFLIKDNELLEKHNEIFEKVSTSIKKEFDSEPV